MNTIIIDCDPWNSLGNSVKNDIVNVVKYVKNTFDSGLYIVSDNCFDIGISIKTKDFASKVNEIKKKSSTLFVIITGHGSQINDTHGDEDDRLDEYIVIGKEMWTDDKLHDLFLTTNTYKFIGIVDTCHSGTMFDMIYEHRKGKKIFNKLWKPTIDTWTTDARCISACSDNETSVCDDNGGSLIQCLLSKGFIKDIVNEVNTDKIFDTVYEELLPLGQHIVLQSNTIL